MNETMPKRDRASNHQLDGNSGDFAEWEQEMAAGAGADWDALETFDDPDTTEQLDPQSLEWQVLENPEEPQIAWVESSNGAATEEEYRQQCYWVIGQFGHALDVLKPNITTDAQAQEWLEMKMTIAAAKSETDTYALAEIRSKMIPVWDEYVRRMNVDWGEFARVRNT